MNLTHEIDPYDGGQIQVENPDMDCLYRGQVSELRLTGEDGVQELHVTLVWMAQWTGSQWVFVNKPKYTVHLGTFERTEMGADRLSMVSAATGDTIVLFTRDDRHNLDPSQVHYISERQPA